MNKRLFQNLNESAIAQEANWSVVKLANIFGASVRVLQRHFRHNMQKSPKAWLAEQRQKRAIELLSAGYSVKEVAAQLGYQYAHNFSREFKSYWGFCPSKQMSPNEPARAICRVQIE